jgi:Domain of unknown function (DUF4190)
MPPSGPGRGTGLVGLRFNPPPGWPAAPEGFLPQPGWRPDPAWPPLPAGWPLVISDDTTASYISPGPHRNADWPASAGSLPQAWPGPVYAGQPPAENGTNGFAVASFILGLLGLVTPAVILSIIFGIIALAQIGKRPQRGKGLAIAGLILSFVWIVVLVVLIAVSIISYRSASALHPTG